MASEIEGGLIGYRARVSTRVTATVTKGVIRAFNAIETIDPIRQVELIWKPLSSDLPAHLLLLRSPEPIAIENWQQATVLGRLAVTATSFRDIAPLPANTPAYYRLLAFNPEQILVMYSDCVSPTQIAPLILLSPPDRSIVQTSTPPLSWQAFPGVSEYALKWGTEPNLSTANEVTGISGTTWSPSSALPEESTVYWQVTSQASTPSIPSPEYDRSSANLAYNKPVITTASNQESWRLTDGDGGYNIYPTGWSCSTNDLPLTMAIDLGASYCIDTIDTLIESDMNAYWWAQAKNMKLEFDDGSSEVVTRPGLLDSWRWVRTVFPPHWTRSLKITILDYYPGGYNPGNSIGFREMNIYANTATQTLVSPVWSFGVNTSDVPPSAPTLLSPADGATTTATPDLVWQESSDPGDFVTYRVEMSQDPSFSTLLASSPTLTAPTWLFAETTPVPSQTPIWWRVQAVDSSGDTTTSSSWNFLVDGIAKPSPFRLVGADSNSPREDWFQTSLHPTLSWEPSSTPSGSLQYLVRYSTSPSLAGLTPLAVTSTSYTIVETLQDHTTYYWDVWAADERGQERKSSGQRYIFYTNAQNEAPNAPTNPTPADGGTVSVQKPLLSWTASDPDTLDWVFYDLYGSFDPTFSTTNFTNWSDRQQYTWPDYLPPDSTLYWKVRAYDLRDAPMGGESWSPLWSFTSTAPTATGLAFPYQSDFEDDNGGWSGWGRSGDWQWGAPSYVGPATTYTGSNCWGTNLTGNYANRQNGYLLGRFTGTSSPCVLSYWQWYDLEANFDYGYLEVSPDAKSWTGVGAAVTGTSSGWQRAITDLSPFVQPGADLYLRFRLSSDDLGNGAGWYLDDISMMPGAVGSMTLSPTGATTGVGQEHIQAAVVRDMANQPLAGVPVLFRVNGTHTATGSAMTDLTGTATWGYTETTTGMDAIVCYAGGVSSEPAANEWILGGYSHLTLTPLRDRERVGIEHLLSVQLCDDFANPILTQGVTVAFAVSGDHTETGTAWTNETGTATWGYAETTPGTDVILASTELTLSNTASVQWLPGPVASVTLTTTTASTAIYGTAAFTALVQDAYGNPVPNAGVKFTVTGDHPQETGYQWEEIATPGGPGQRLGSAMVFDQDHELLLMFGGKNKGSTLLTVIIPQGEKEGAMEWKTPPVSSSLVFAQNNEAKENRRCQTIVLQCPSACQSWRCLLNVPWKEAAWK